MEELIRIVVTALVNALDKKDKNDKKKLEDSNDFVLLKNILKEGSYKTNSYDYNNKKKGNGMIKITHSNNKIEIDHEMNIKSEIAGDKNTNDNHVLKRTGTIKLDSYNRIYVNQQTNCTKINQGISQQAKRAVKNMELHSISESEAIFVGSGSSHSTKKYHGLSSIKKIIRKKDDNSFVIDTYLDEKRTERSDQSSDYYCYYAGVK
tara:strand:+ start:31 stop:648 length:618 start_codon:yes stop_codon:yes gene_type:complete